MDRQIADYPRPLLYRKDWTNLNGEWDFAFDDENIGLSEGWQSGFEPGRSICVPFSYETKASGIGDETVHETVWYQKRISTETVAETETVLLHFEGCDYRASVYANGILLGTHTGGYARFSFDLAPALPAKEVLLVIRAEDSLSQKQPRGKQRYKPESWGCWYVQTTGIWKTVWYERVSKARVTSLDILPDPATGEVKFLTSQTDPSAKLYVSVYENERMIAGTEGTKLTVPSPKLWSPKDPFLYTVRAELYLEGKRTDTVQSYFGFRTITWNQSGLQINGCRTYLRMVLDQGYWPDSGLTPPDTGALMTDLDAVERYGYNGVRKHQKIEDERFLYLCDIRGILVFSEMAAAYAYDEEADTEFCRQWNEIVLQNRRHPCIIAWVPFNESWGVGGIRSDKQQQDFVNRVAAITKSLDPQRPVVSNDGWEHTVSDLVTIHDYRETGEELLAQHENGDEAVIKGEHSYSWYGQKLFAEGYSYRNQPLLLSEYGGIAMQTESGWGYGKQAADEDAFLQRFLGQNEAIREMPQYSGFCYTQLTDVEQEKNGLLDADRRDKLSEAGIESIRASNASF